MRDHSDAEKFLGLKGATLKKNNKDTMTTMALCDNRIYLFEVTCLHEDVCPSKICVYFPQDY